MLSASPCKVCLNKMQGLLVSRAQGPHTVIDAGNDTSWCVLMSRKCVRMPMRARGESAKVFQFCLSGDCSGERRVLCHIEAALPMLWMPGVSWIRRLSASLNSSKMPADGFTALRRPLTSFDVSKALYVSRCRGGRLLRSAFNFATKALAKVWSSNQLCCEGCEGCENFREVWLSNLCCDSTFQCPPIGRPVESCWSFGCVTFAELRPQVYSDVVLNSKVCSSKVPSWFPPPWQAFRSAVGATQRQARPKRRRSCALQAMGQPTFQWESIVPIVPMQPVREAQTWKKGTIRGFLFNLLAAPRLFSDRRLISYPTSPLCTPACIRVLYWSPRVFGTF